MSFLRNIISPSNSAPRSRNAALVLSSLFSAALWVLLPNCASALSDVKNNATALTTTQAEIERAAHLIDQGKISEADKILKALLDDSGTTLDSTSKILSLGLLSDTRLVAGSTQDALDYAEKAVSLSLKSDNRELKARSGTYLGNAYIAMGRLNDAQQIYQQSLGFAQQADNESLQISLIINRLHIQLALGEWDEATTVLQRTFAKLSHAQSTNQLYDLITLSYLAERVIRQNPTSPNKAELKKQTFQALNKAKTLAFAFGDKELQSMATGYMAELYSIDKRYKEAEQMLRQALFLSLENNTRYLSGRWHWQLGRLLVETDRKADAITAYYDAIGMFRDIQPVLLQGWRGDPKAFRNTIGVVYEELAKLLLDKADHSPNEAKQAILKSIQYVMEEYKAVELKEYFQDACVTEHFGKNHDVELGSLIDSGTAVLYPVLFSDHMVLMLSQSDGNIYYTSVPVSRGQIEAQARQFRSLMNPSSNPRQMLTLSMSLYDQLIRPIATQLDRYQVNQLIIVPEGELRTIPFAALYDGEHYLVNHYALAVSPGLLLTDVSKADAESHQLFSGGLSEAVQGFSRLPYVKEEVANISQVYTGKTYLDQNFTKSKVLSELENTDYQWVTFSTHGIINRNFNQSYLLTYDRKLTFDELKLALQAGQFKPGGVDLLVLSACDTAVGDDRAALGLAGLALKAGVKSTMASLWTVNDKYTAELIPAFLSQLKQGGVSKAEALRKAQLQLINEHDISHPYYWAAFVIAGNWL